jgi:hypothetical protein
MVTLSACDFSALAPGLALKQAIDIVQTGLNPKDKPDLAGDQQRCVLNGHDRRDVVEEQKGGSNVGIGGLLVLVNRKL